MSECVSTFQRSPHDKKNPYVMINKEMIRDPGISPKAKGVLCYLLSLPDDWKIYHSQLQSALNIGEKYLNSAMDELLKSGYAKRSRAIDLGTYTPYNYEFSESKIFLSKEIENDDPSAVLEAPSDLLGTAKGGLQKEDVLNTLHTHTPHIHSEYVYSSVDIKNQVITSLPPQKQKNQQPNSPEARGLAQTLFFSIKSWKPEIKEPDLEKWAKESESLLKKFGKERAETIIAWLPTDDFWRKNILSPKKLKEQLERLEMERDAHEVQEWYRKNLLHVKNSKIESGRVLDHCFVKGDWVINSKTSKELSLKMLPSAFESAFATAMGVKLG